MQLVFTGDLAESFLLTKYLKNDFRFESGGKLTTTFCFHG